VKEKAKENILFIKLEETIKNKWDEVEKTEGELS
jgi:hypothetical protein